MEKKHSKLFGLLRRKEQEKKQAIPVSTTATDNADLDARYPEAVLRTPEGAMDFILHHGLHEMLETEDAVEDGRLFLPAWHATLTPEIAQLTPQGIVLNLHLSAPQWGTSLFECSVGMGADSMRTNIGMATGSFLFSFMQGVSRMERQEDPLSLRTSFAGREHRWKVYRSNIVGMGAVPELRDPDVYWDALSEGIAKRLGNQKLCYVKVYGAKMGDDITGECRVNDVKSEELSAIVSGLVRRWDVRGFASQKQFFFLRQEPDTVLPYPYFGPEDAALLRERIIAAVRLFHACKTEADFDTLKERTAQATGDPILAAECHTFLPEICTQNAFPEVGYQETVDLIWPGGEKTTVYKNQLADYYPMVNALFSAFSEGVFGEAANDIYRSYIASSASHGAIAQAQEKGSNLSDLRMTALLCSVDDTFALR